jgi:cation transporter-like permease
MGSKTSTGSPMIPHFLILATLGFLAGLLLRSGEPVWAFACWLCCFVPLVRIVAGNKRGKRFLHVPRL